MADKFVNKSGNDSNSGNDVDNAYLSIERAMTQGGDGVNIYVGAGTYSLGSVGYTNKSSNLYPEGLVVIDGASVGYEAIVSSGDNKAIIFYCITGGQWHFKNYTPTVFQGFHNGHYLGIEWNPTNHPNAPFAIIENCDAAYAYGSNGAGVMPQFAHVIFKNIEQVISYQYGSARITNTLAWIKHCIIVDCRYVWVGSPSDTAPLIIYNNIIKDVSSNIPLKAMINHPLGMIPDADYNCYFNVERFRETGPITTFAAWQGLGLDPNGMEADPQLIDSDNLIISVPYTSPVVGSGQGPQVSIQNIGSAKVGAGLSDTANPSVWADAIFDNVEIDSEGEYTLIDQGLNGTVKTGVLDLGRVYNVQSAYPRFIESPSLGRKVDYDNTDVKPNLHQYRYRFSLYPFLKDAGSPSWIVANQCDIIGPLFARFMQFELTLRIDGVEA